LKALIHWRAANLLSPADAGLLMVSVVIAAP
jgi:hypothetical protein